MRTARQLAVLATSNGAGGRGFGLVGPRRRGRWAALRVICALGTLAATVAGLVGVASCRGEPEACGGVGPDAALHLIMANDRLKGAQLTISGACTSPACVKPIDAGCAEWWVQVTGGNGTACVLTFTTAEGVLLIEQVDGATGCDILGHTIEL